MRLAQLPVIDISGLAIVGLREEFLDILNEMSERFMTQNEILNRELNVLRTLVQLK